MDGTNKAKNRAIGIILFKPKSNTMLRNTVFEAIITQGANRHKLSGGHEEIITKIWEKRKELNKDLWNGTKFRFHEIKENNDKVTLHLGITDYKDFLGTNYSSQVNLYQKLGLNKFGNSQAFLSDPIGVGGLVLSNDNKMPLIRRSNKCSEAIAQLDVPGGHPEPEEIFGKLDKDYIMTSALSTNSSSDAIVAEIFDSILREVRDEINIPIQNMDEPLFMGIAGNEICANKPTAEFFIRSSLHSHEILGCYSKGTHSESYESTELHMLAVEDALKLEKCSIWTQLTPSGKAAIQLYKELTKPLL